MALDPTEPTPDPHTRQVRVDTESADEVARLEQAMEAFLGWEGTDEPAAAFLSRHESLRDLLEPLLVEPGVGDLDEPRMLGDYRVLRELGRGGMGVVYDAEQVSLGRRVALKVLPPHVTLTSAAVARFKREATTAARLQHPNIVAIYSVGSAGDQHFIAMELVAGTALDEILAQLADHPVHDRDGSSVLRILEDTAALAAPSTTEVDGVHGLFTKDYVRLMAGVVVQIADALQHAADHDIVHRDVKPGNILLRPDGVAMLADFGLAKQDTLPSLTVTGHFAGTPSYVSPEQARADHSVDHRSDIYSLGATLYELLTGRVPFRGNSAQETLQQIVRDVPVDPVRHNPSLPPDLAAIVLKCLEKEPARRYQNASEFAADLRAFLDYRPVSARRATAARKLSRWIRREPLKASILALTVASLVVITALAGYIFIEKAERVQRLAQEAEDAHRDAGVAFQLGRYEKAIADVDRAFKLMDDVDFTLDDDLQMELVYLKEDAQAQMALARQAAANARLLTKLKDVRQPEGDEHYPVHWDAVAASYHACFRNASLDLLNQDDDTAVALLKARQMSDELLAMIDTWAVACLRGGESDAGRRLLGIVRRVDPDSFRDAIRTANEQNDTQRLIALATDQKLAAQPAVTFELLASALARAAKRNEALQVYEVGWKLHRRDFVLAVGLARTLFDFGRAQESVRLYYVALALHDSVEVRHELGRILDEQLQEPQRAAELLAESCARRPEDDHLLWHFAKALHHAGELDRAKEAYETLIGLRPKLGSAHQGLASLLYDLRQPKRALPHAQRSAKLESRNGGNRYTLGQILMDLDRPAEAEQAFRAAATLGLDTDLLRAQNLNNLGTALAAQDKIAEARDAFAKATRVFPAFAQAHLNHGIALRQLGESDAAVKVLETAAVKAEASRQSGQAAFAHYHLGDVHAASSRHDAAIRSYDRALALRPGFAEAACRKGHALYDAKRPEEAVRAFRLAFEKNADLLTDPNGIHGDIAAAAAIAVAERQSALTWLRARLSTWQNIGGERARAEVGNWLTMPAYAAVRGERLSELDADERAAWSGFWQRVSSLAGK